jgi:hypothetical protein
MVRSRSEYYTSMSICGLPTFLAHLTQRVMWGIAITWRSCLSQCQTEKKSFNSEMAWNITRTNLLVSNNVRYDVMFQLLTNKFVLVMFQAISELKLFFSVWHWVRQELGFCLTHGLCVCPTIFFVILYITCQILFFIQNWMQDYLPCIYCLCFDRLTVSTLNINWHRQRKMQCR